MRINCNCNCMLLRTKQHNEMVRGRRLDIKYNSTRTKRLSSLDNPAVTSRMLLLFSSRGDTCMHF
jgi:hypothetical protein